MTCKDCMHSPVCRLPFNTSKTQVNFAEECHHFKNKADFVEVKHGRFETRNFIVFDSEKVGYRCSECKTTWDTETNYCPYCGADMRKEGADNG